MTNVNNETNILKFILATQAGSSSLEEAWMEGYAMAQAELDTSKNPLLRSSSEYEFWSEGYMAGFYNEEALFPEHAVYIERTSVPAVANDKERIITTIINKR